MARKDVVVLCIVREKKGHLSCCLPLEETDNEERAALAQGECALVSTFSVNLGREMVQNLHVLEVLLGDDHPITDALTAIIQRAFEIGQNHAGQ